MPICLKSVTSSVRSFISCSSFSSLASRFSFLLSSPFFIQPLTLLPCRSNTARFSSILFISCVYISCCISGDWGIFHRLGYAGHRIMQRVFEQVAYVIPSFFSFHKIFVRDVRIAFLEVHTELVDGFRIGEYNPTLSGRIPDYAWSYT